MKADRLILGGQVICLFQQDVLSMLVRREEDVSWVTLGIWPVEALSATYVVW